ncbi:hypothetical protein DFJ43DRAFT_1207089, partial [Lentinula guzmanii]
SENLSCVRAGYYPFGSERAAYDKLLGDTQIELDRCQKEIDRLEILCNTLIASKQLLQANKRLIHSILSPIHKLPLDLLGNIFEHLCYDRNYLYGSSLPNVPTLNLSSVCHRWRSLVSSMPILWSTFNMIEKEFARPHNLLPLFLGRSHPCPIDFQLHDRNECEGSSRTSKYISSLLLHSDRWRHVEIRSQFLPVYLLQPLIKNGAQLPSLKSLTLGMGDDEIDDTDFPMTCANLKSLTVNQRGLELQFPRPTITRL